MGADQDIHLALFQLFQGSLDLRGRTGPADIIDLAREILQALTKRLVMLESQYGGGYQHGHLLIVRYRLECRTDSHLGLSETNVSTNQPVHRTGTFHIRLDLGGSLHLVRRVLIDEAGFQLMLHEAVRRVGETRLLLAFGIEEDQVPGDILHLRLGTFLHLFPCACAELAQLRRLAALFPLVFR